LPHSVFLLVIFKERELGHPQEFKFLVVKQSSFLAISTLSCPVNRTQLIFVGNKAYEVSGFCPHSCQNGLDFVLGKEFGNRDLCSFSPQLSRPFPLHHRFYEFTKGIYFLSAEFISTSFGIYRPNASSVFDGIGKYLKATVFHKV